MEASRAAARIGESEPVAGRNRGAGGLGHAMLGHARIHRHGAAGDSGALVTGAAAEAAADGNRSGEAEKGCEGSCQTEDSDEPGDCGPSTTIVLPVRIGVLTGGGDCPGLNAVIRAIVRKGIDRHGHAIVGFRDGWRGPLENAYEELTIESTRGILPRGGTILRSSRTNPFARDDGPDRIRENLTTLHLDGLIAIGGEDTLGAAARLYNDHDLPVVGVPKTIDNDLGGTDMTFGFDTAVQIATEAIDRLHTTAESHNRVMIVEVMGRHAGWIALHSGLAGGADVILIPERPFDIEEVVRLIRRRHSRGRYFSIVVVAEGALPIEGTMETVEGSRDEFGHARLGGIGQRLEREIEQRTGFDTRATVLGHIQRGGTPTAFDRVLATRLGLAAVDAVNDGRWGVMPALRGTRIELVALSEAVADLRTVPADEYEAAETFFG
jgi:ATP-dependent phosphofructokinase / diphosphate-dependent phosphofructokinase